MTLEEPGYAGGYDYDQHIAASDPGNSACVADPTRDRGPSLIAVRLRTSKEEFRFDDTTRTGTGAKKVEVTA